jgi:hypothetical protein
MKRLALACVALLAVAACARILGIEPREAGPFEHRAHVLEGIACVTCHPGMESAGDEGPLHLPDTATCLECHAQPHTQQRCRDCHGDPFTEIELAGNRKHLRFSHAEHLAELPGQCVSCHRNVATEGAELRTRIDACLDCHGDDPRFARSECDTCHVDLSMDPRPPRSHMTHPADFADSHGPMAAGARDSCASCHSERFCTQCHGASVPALPWRLDPADPMAPSVHRAGFRARHAEESRLAPASCASCHSEKFCSDCHTDSGVAATGAAISASPHPPGWVSIGPGGNEHGRAARRDPAACASCHGGAGEMLCVSCHQVGGIGGSPHAPGWSSRQDLSDTPCRLCHTGAR